MSMSYEPHPVAALFPMLGDDELSDLAADIAARGLLHPIVLDADGRVLDGRNRLAACRRAEVTPRFETYEGDDPAGYALAANLQRRNLTKGQSAMVAAQAIKAGVSYNSYTDGPSRGYISHATTVLHYAGDLADGVVAGSISLKDAYVEAQQRKQASEGREAQLERLRADAPDLAAKVVEGELTLAGAQAELKERREQRRRLVIAYRTVVYDSALALTRLFDGTDPAGVGADIAEYAAIEFADTSPETLDQAAAGLAAVASAWRKHVQETD
jgi:ParB/Sulfiredoxin domain